MKSWQVENWNYIEQVEKLNSWIHLSFYSEMHNRSFNFKLFIVLIGSWKLIVEIISLELSTSIYVYLYKYIYIYIYMHVYIYAQIYVRSASQSATPMQPASQPRGALSTVQLSNFWPFNISTFQLFYYWEYLNFQLWTLVLAPTNFSCAVKGKLKSSNKLNSWINEARAQIEKLEIEHILQ